MASRTRFEGEVSQEAQRRAGIEIRKHDGENDRLAHQISGKLSRSAMQLVHYLELGVGAILAGSRSRLGLGPLMRASTDFGL